MVPVDQDAKSGDLINSTISAGVYPIEYKAPTIAPIDVPAM